MNEIIALLKARSNVNYDHIAHDMDVTISFTAEEVKTILEAYDYGFDLLDEKSRELFMNSIMFKLKDAIHP